MAVRAADAGHLHSGVAPRESRSRAGIWFIIGRTMRRALVAIAVCVGCNEDSLSLTVERQSTSLRNAQAQRTEWVAGSGVVAIDAPIFPQPLALRFTVSYDDGLDQAIDDVSWDAYSGGALELSQDVSCPSRLGETSATYCVAEFRVLSEEPTTLVFTVDAPSGPLIECFYYAVVDATADVAALTHDLDRSLARCRSEYAQ
jgi:hypothetical protein